MRSPMQLAAIGAAAGILLLSGCTADSDRIIYEVYSSGPGAKVTYAESEGLEPLQIEQELTETTWTFAPALNPGATTPMVSVSPPAGQAVRCRILLLNDTKIKIVADEIGLINEDVECVHDDK